jgi:hypothetical protein
MKYIVPLCVVVSSLVLSGCGVFQSSARKHALPADGTKSYWFDYDSNRRGAFLLSGDRNFKVLSEPAPDTAVQNLMKLAGSLNYQGVTGQLSADLSQQIIQLGQRTEMILFLRETMFRLSEAGNNAGWKEGDYKELYKKIVEASVTLALAEKTMADARKTEADARKIKAEADLERARKAIQAIPEADPHATTATHQ